MPEDSELNLIKKLIKKKKREEKLRFWNQSEKRHLKQIESIKSDKRLVAIFGGNRTAKTVSGATRCILTLLGKDAEPYIQDWCDEDQEWWYEKYYPIKGEVDAWAATVSWDTHRDVVQPIIKEWLPKPILNKCEEVNRKAGVIDTLEFPNQSRLTFKSYESRRDAFQGKALDMIWFDEECPLGIWEEGRQRVLDKKGEIILTMTPLKGLTWPYSRVFLNETDPEIHVIQISWEDNPFLDKEEIERLSAELSEDERAARKHGEFLPAGATVLSKANLIDRREQIEEPIARMSWSDNKHFVVDSEGELEIYEKPQKNTYYIIGADVAEGLPNGDNSVACVINADTAEQVAEMTVKVDSTTFAEQLAELGKLYNMALIVPERNNNGHAVIQHLDRVVVYPSLYKHNDGRLGWPQNVQTRPIVVSFMQDFVREMPQVINSFGLISEGFSFVRNSRGRAEASGKKKAGGSKDDRLFAWGIALATRDMYGEPLDAVIPKRKKMKILDNPQGDPWLEKDGDIDVQAAQYASFDPNSFARFPSEGVKSRGS